MLAPGDFFELEAFPHRSLFDGLERVWEALPRLKTFLRDALSAGLLPLGGDMLTKTCVLFEGEIIRDGFEIRSGDATKGAMKVFRKGVELQGASVLHAGAVFFDGPVRIGRGCVVEPGALIKGPTLIGDFTEVRQGAYVRGTCLIGSRCVVGHTTEIKGSVMLDGAKAGHFAYVGDSILGNNVNLGAGTKLANLKIIAQEVRIRIERETHATGLRKLGAILGDGCELGCNAVTSPGTLLGKRSLVYPCHNVPPGYYPPRSILGGKARRPRSGQ